MNVDRNILLALLGVAVGVNVLDESAEFLPLALFGLGLSVFFVERVLIGPALSFAAMTVPSVFLLGFISILCLGMVLTWDSFDGTARSLYLQALVVTLVVFPIGVWLANLVCALMLGRTRTVDFAQLCLSTVDETFEDFFWLFLLISLGILVLFFAMSEHVQLIDVLLQSPTAPDPDWVRFTQTELPKSVQYSFEIARRVLLPICMLYAYFMRLALGGKWNWLFPAVFALALFVSLLTLDRSPPMAILAMLAAAHFLSHRDRPSKWLVLAAIVVAGIVLAGVISNFQYQSYSISVEDVFENSWYVATYRIFGSPQEMAIRAFETYNYETHFLNGDYVRLFSFLPGGQYVESASINADALAAAPVTFVGDLWRNWGWPGVIVGAFAYGFVLQFLQIYIFDKMTVVRGAIYVMLMLGSLAVLHGNAFGVVTLSVILLTGVLGVFIVRLDRLPRVTA